MSLPSILEKIVQHKQREVAARKAAAGQPSTINHQPSTPRAFAAALTGGRVRLIAEVKKASPSRGVLRADFDPVALGETYAANGAAAISVLTDEEFFQGRGEYLRAVRERVPVPVLRKEFIIDPWQIGESRALGADAILLIVALLELATLRDFIGRAAELGMASLVEVHTEGELETALESGARIIGVNNRDLHTFTTTLETTERLGPVIKREGRLLVSESGIDTPEHVARVAAAGADAILVGEALVVAEDTGGKVRELAGVGRRGNGEMRK